LSYCDIPAVLLISGTRMEFCYDHFNVSYNFSYYIEQAQ